MPTRRARRRCEALAEQRLAEESYRKLFEASVDGIYVTTPGGDLLDANPALARMMGYATPKDLIKGIGDVANSVYLHPSAREQYQFLMRRDGMVREFEYQVRARDGTILWLSDSASAVRNEAGEIARYEGVVRDITDQKRAEDAIAEGRRLLQQVIDTVPAVINVKDKELRYVLMNRYMAGIFGIEPQDAIGRTTADLMSRYGAAKTDEHDKRVLAGGRELGFYEEEYKDSAGNMRQWLVNKLPLLDAEGEIENIVTVALDIGERKRGEQEMRKARDAAEAALRNLRETQNSLIEAEKLAALGRLVAGIAHEVNNPVGISLTVASALERKTALFASEVERGNLRRSSLTDYLETSRDASSQLVANLNRAAELITSFKQVAADRNYSDQRVFDLGDLTEQVVMSLRPGLRKHNLTLNVECQPNLSMNSYPGPYGQVLTNLFLNAVAHAFPDGKSGAVDIQVRASGKDNVEILFSDNGVGMSLDVRRRAFDPFFTTRRDQGGTGLGLHIVYSIVTTRLGGRLDLEFRARRRHPHPDDPAARRAAGAGGGVGVFPNSAASAGDPAACFCPGCFQIRCPSLKAEGAGNAGCALHPRSRVPRIAHLAHTSIQVSGEHSDIPCAMALRLTSCSPRWSGLVVTVTPAETCFPDLAPAYAAPGPHDLTVRSRTIRL